MSGSESERTAKDSQDEFESIEVEATKFGENRASGITVSTNADDSLVYCLAHKSLTVSANDYPQHYDLDETLSTI